MSRGNRITGLRGFTIVEAVATIAVVSVVAVLSVRIISSGIQGYTTAATGAELQAQLSVALDRVMMELRQIPARSGSSPIAPDITTVTASSIAFRTDYSIGLSGTDLTLTEDGGSAGVLARNVSGLVIQCYDENNNALSASLSGGAIDAVRRIEVTITCSRAGVSQSLRSKVFLRSLMAGGTS